MGKSNDLLNISRGSSLCASHFYSPSYEPELVWTRFYRKDSPAWNYPSLVGARASRRHHLFYILPFFPEYIVVILILSLVYLFSWVWVYSYGEFWVVATLHLLKPGVGNAIQLTNGNWNRKHRPVIVYWVYADNGTPKFVYDLFIIHHNPFSLDPPRAYYFFITFLMHQLRIFVVYRFQFHCLKKKLLS